MSKDRRKKGCPNLDCEMNKKKVKQEAENEFCPKCGSKLVFVCSKCFSQIQDKGNKHRICEYCMIEVEETWKNRKDAAGNVVKIVSIPVMVAANAFVGESKKIVISKAGQIGKEAAKMILKKI